MEETELRRPTAANEKARRNGANPLLVFDEARMRDSIKSFKEAEAEAEAN